MEANAALQYQTDWRNVAGWKVDRMPGSIYDKINGVDGYSAMIGFNHNFTKSFRGTMSYYHFDGQHKLEDGSTQDGARQTVNAVLDYRLSKTFLLYSSFTWSKGHDVLDNQDCSLILSRIGMMKFF